MEFREAAMSRQITLEIHNAANDVIGQYQLDTAGKTQHIQAVNGASYQFTDLATGLGPQHITTAKQGSDLLVTFDSGSNLIIENYFTQGQGALVGINADGGLISYPARLTGRRRACSGRRCAGEPR